MKSYESFLDWLELLAGVSHSPLGLCNSDELPDGLKRGLQNSKGIDGINPPSMANPVIPGGDWSAIRNVFLDVGAQPAPPLTRAERRWWAWQMFKRGEFRSAWAYIRYTASARSRRWGGKMADHPNCDFIRDQWRPAATPATNSPDHTLLIMAAAMKEIVARLEELESKVRAIGGKS